MEELVEIFVDKYNFLDNIKSNFSLDEDSSNILTNFSLSLLKDFIGILSPHLGHKPEGIHNIVFLMFNIIKSNQTKTIVNTTYQKNFDISSDTELFEKIGREVGITMEEKIFNNKPKEEPPSSIDDIQTHENQEQKENL